MMMRGARLVLFGLGLIAGLSLSADPALADPVSMADTGIFALPILIMLVNYPLNGMMLYVVIRGVAGRASFKARVDSRFVWDFMGAVLLFTALGALIDYLVFYDDDVTSPFAFIGGIAAIVIACALICHRYILTNARLTAVTTTCMGAINVLGWYFLLLVWEYVFANICLPMDCLLWILFLVLVFKSIGMTGTSIAEQEVPQPSTGTSPEHPAHGPFRTDVSKMEMGKRRVELWMAGTTLVVVVMIVSGVRII